MNVKLISYTPNPEKIPAMAAMLTHSKSKPEDLEKTSEKHLNTVLEEVIKLGHTSVIEHTSFTFTISDVSRSLTHQLVRHRIANYAQQSQRYVDFKEPNYVTPPTISKNNKMKKAYEETMTIIWKQYNKLLEMGIPAEDSRFILPNAVCTNIMVTMNARSLLNFFELRCCQHAQWEIRELAYKMLKEVKKVAPIIFKNAGPTCKTKKICHENKIDCPLYPK
jgi:thymidylate synthase (FAD)